MGLMADDLWDISDEAQPKSMSIGEDFGSHSDYSSTLTRRTALTAWLRWTCLSPHGVKPSLPIIGHHDLSRSTGAPRKLESGPHGPIKGSKLRSRSLLAPPGLKTKG
jgi:hypothetical protein